MMAHSDKCDGVHLPDSLLAVTEGKTEEVHPVP